MDKKKVLYYFNNLDSDRIGQKNFSIFFVFCVALQCILYISLKITQNLMHVEYPFLNAITIILMILFMTLSAPYIFKCLNRYHIIACLSIIMLFCLSYTLNEGKEEIVLKVGQEILERGFFFILFGAALYNNKDSDKSLLAIGIVISLYGLLYVILNNSAIGYDHQYIAYLILPAPLIFWNRLVNKFNIFDLILFIADVFFVFAMGSRTPVLTIGIFMMLKVLVGMRFHWKRNLFFFILMLIAFVLLVVFNEEVLLFLKDLFEKLNLSTRIIDSLLNDEFLNSNGRKEIYTCAINIIKNNPLGVGIGMDRLLIYMGLGNALNLTNAMGYYSHNFILDIMLNFGVPFGILVLLILIGLSLYTLIKCKDKNDNDMFLILLLLGIVPLLASDFYLKNCYFMMYLGFIISSIKIKRFSFL